MTERILDENYYELACLSWLIKIGEIFQPKVIHNQPEFYGLTQADSVKIRLKCLRQQAKDLKDEYSVIKAQYLQGKREFGYITMNALQERADKLSKAIYFNRQRLKGDTANQPFDLESLKRIPIDSIVKVNPNGFFQSNPFRTEKEPSNSLFYYKSTNRYMDFATSKGGDVVDLYMAVHSVDFKTACKELSSL